jgi:hypothetical protein
MYWELRNDKVIDDCRLAIAIGPMQDEVGTTAQ